MFSGVRGCLVAFGGKPKAFSVFGAKPGSAMIFEIKNLKL